MQRLERWLVGLALALLAFGIALQPLLLPVFTEALSARYSRLPISQALGPAEATREFVVTGSPGSRSELERLMPAEAVQHLDDVRRVIAGAMGASLALSVAVSVWMLISVTSGRKGAVAAALWVGGLLAGGFVALVALVAVIDFNLFFVAFHSVFFKAGTWVFPSDSLLIMLFPEEFWVTSGISFGVLIALVSACYLAAAALLSRSAKRDGAEDGASTRP